MRLKEDNADLSCRSFNDLELMKAVLAKGASYRFPAYGFSMYPFIRNGDIITVSLLAKERKAGFGRVVALIHPLSGKLIVHRVIGRQSASCLIKGDNAFEVDGLVEDQNILGYVSKAERNGKRIILGLGLERYGVACLSRFLPLFPTLLLLWKHTRQFLLKTKKGCKCAVHL